MDPKQTPPPKLPADEVLHAYSPRPAVRRLNPRAVTILLGVIGLVFAGRMIVKLFGDAASQSDDKQLRTSRFRATDDMLERGPIGRLPNDYSFLPPPPKRPEPVAEPEQPVENEPELDPETLRRLEQLRRELESAMDSPIVFRGGHAQAPAPTQLVPGQIAPIASTASAVSGGGVALLTGDAQNRTFFTQAAQVQTYVNARLEAPRSPYEVKAGTIIPAALITSINSDLPGDTIGQVTTNVYDSVSGRFLLIPQGTRLIGRYNSEVLNGQNRVLIAWQRLILPNGYSIVLEAMPGTDAAGVAGMADRVDHHFDRLLGATLLSTLIALGGNLAVNTNGNNDHLDIVGSTVAQQASRIGQRLIDRELDLKPTIHIRAGSPFNVLVNRDLILTPYQRVRNGR